MARTHLDELVEYPNKVITEICNSAECIALLLNKNIDNITEDDVDEALEKHITTYEYIDNTISESGAYIWVEAEIPRVENKQIKNMKLFVTVCCHKRFMDFTTAIIPGLSGNRRDNLVRFIDKQINDTDFGIGKIKLDNVRTLSSSNTEFTLREMTYSVPDFNIKEL